MGRHLGMCISVSIFLYTYRLAHVCMGSSMRGSIYFFSAGLILALVGVGGTTIGRGQHSALDAGARGASNG